MYLDYNNELKKLEEKPDNDYKNIRINTGMRFDKNLYIPFIGIENKTYLNISENTFISGGLDFSYISNITTDGQKFYGYGYSSEIFNITLPKINFGLKINEKINIYTCYNLQLNISTNIDALTYNQFKRTSFYGSGGLGFEIKTTKKMYLQSKILFKEFNIDNSQIEINLSTEIF